MAPAAAGAEVEAALARIESRPPLSAGTVRRHVFTERRDDGSLELGRTSKTALARQLITHIAARYRATGRPRIPRLRGVS